MAVGLGLRGLDLMAFGKGDLRTGNDGSCGVSDLAAENTGRRRYLLRKRDERH
jgi:hypothetical protein